jgi:uncharacterized protein YxeA
MKKLLIGLFLVLVSCIGCAPTQWAHSDPQYNNQMSFAYESQQCQVYAKQMSNSGQTAYNWQQALTIAAVEGIAAAAYYEECMRSKGYYKVQLNKE